MTGGIPGAEELFGQEMSDGQKGLFLSDFARLCAEYFEGMTEAEMDATRLPDGYSVCIVFSARRIKKCRTI